ncbi:hypothetical protein ACN6K4_003322 [Streptomyces hayashii]|uniref:hypothetical protein n=1 Tax=Streptomyces hayashii TaxID=2839966 RepID=UPI00403C994C
MTTSDLETPAMAEAEYKIAALGAAVVRNAKRPKERIAAQALAEERTILAMPQVQAALVVRDGGRVTCRWEGLTGKLYTLPLDSQQRAFLGLVLSLLGIGSTTLSAVSDLDPERLRVMTQAILRLAGDDSIAIGTRL